MSGSGAPPSGHRGRGPNDDFRPEIEGLRAIAVVAVVLYHARLGPFHGGYIGVDVFYVLSGYLITRLMTGEVARTGTVALPAFWARRARRLLPGSTTVVAVTVLASSWLLDPLSQRFVNRSAIAASAFAANVLFWGRGGYSQLTVPEPLLHFWSLAVEEQFYVVWPLVVWAVARSRGHLERMLGGVVVVIGSMSLIACVLLTPHHQLFAFYWLPTRAWELMAGAGLVLAAPALHRIPPAVRAYLAWSGLVAVSVSFVAYVDPQRGFPGTLALVPVVATSMMIAGCGPDVARSPAALLSHAGLAWIGRRSYSIYLWHLPVLVMAEVRWGPLAATTRLALVALSVAIAAGSFSLLEDPIRRDAWLARRPARSLTIGAGLIVMGLLVGVFAGRSVVVADTGVVAASATLTGAPAALVAAEAPVPLATVAAGPGTGVAVIETPTVGSVAGTIPTTSSVTATTAAGPYPANPAALVALAAANRPTLESAVTTKVAPSNLRPAVSHGAADTPAIYDNGCIVGDGTSKLKDCIYGDAKSAVTVVLFGDSHAAQWFPAFEAAAGQRHWRLVVLTKMGCPTAEIRVTNAQRHAECTPWRDRVIARIGDLHPDVVVMSAYRYKGNNDAGWKTGLDVTMTKLRPLADHVVLLGDTPTPSVNVPACISGHLRSLPACMTSRDDAIRPGRLAVEYQVAQAHQADFVTTYEWLCTDAWCPVVVGDVLMYRDDSHITATAASLLTPYIETMIQGVVAG